MTGSRLEGIAGKTRTWRRSLTMGSETAECQETVNLQVNKLEVNVSVRSLKWWCGFALSRLRWEHSKAIEFLSPWLLLPFHWKYGYIILTRTILSQNQAAVRYGVVVNITVSQVRDPIDLDLCDHGSPWFNSWYRNKFFLSM